ncbi:tyrosine protein kinase, partial [Aureobasidium melanogenum]
MAKVIFYLGMSRSEGSFKHVEIDRLVLLLYCLLCKTKIDQNNFSACVDNSNSFSDLLVLVVDVAFSGSQHEAAEGAANSSQQIVHLLLFLAVGQTALFVEPIQDSANGIAIDPFLSQPSAFPVKSQDSRLWPRREFAGGSIACPEYGVSMASLVASAPWVSRSGAGVESSRFEKGKGNWWRTWPVEEASVDAIAGYAGCCNRKKCSCHEQERHGQNRNQALALAFGPRHLFLMRRI